MEAPSGVARRPSCLGRQAYGELEAEANSCGRLCKVGKFVKVQLIEPKVGNLVKKAPILCAKSNVVRDSKIRAAAVHKGATSLPVRSGHDELIGRVENHRASSAKGVGLDVTVSAGQINNHRTDRLMKVRLNSGRPTKGHEVLSVTRVTIVPFGRNPFVELIG